MKKRTKNRKKKISRMVWIAVVILTVIAVGTAVGLHFFAGDKVGGEGLFGEEGLFANNKSKWQEPDELLLTYMGLISQEKYQQMYGMLDAEAAENISGEDFIKRNAAIYEGMEVRNMETTVISYDKKAGRVTYQTSFDTAAGNVSFENEVYFHKGEKGYGLLWEDSLIYPGLQSTDKVRVSMTQAERGQILDRNGRVLAGKGAASSVGIVPGKLENRAQALEKAAKLLGLEFADVEKKLSAKWVKEDSFVPIKTVRKVQATDLMSMDADEEVIREQERQQQLLEIPGVMISDTEVRSYPLGEAAAHLVGYVQNVTAEDLQEHAGEGYRANSVIGRSGVEGLFEKDLKGQDGCRIYIVDAEGDEKIEIACKVVQHGKDIKLTVDAELQTDLYEQFREDKSCHVAMQPYTGEVLALVSTPSYDNNDFILGLSNEQWTALNEDDSKPMYNRFRQKWCPGSTFKPITAAIGLESGADMACIYTAFCNQGNVVKPYFIQKQEMEYWLAGAFSVDTTNMVLEGIKKVVNDPHGTGYAAHREDVLLAGKTGTAEIKASQDDTSGTELGWFAIFTAEKTAERPILLVSMTEDVKERGGSGYVVEKDRQVLEHWFAD